MAVLEASPVVGSYSSRTILGQMTEDGSNVFRNVTQIEQPGVTIAWAGNVNKSGKFSASEDELLKDAIETYRLREGLSPEQIKSMIFTKNKKRKGNTFWSEIAAALPHRSFNSVYARVRRVEHPMKQQGYWAKDEDTRLASAVCDLGQSWEKVSLRVGRTASDCKDRYRNHVLKRENRITGKWSPDEEAKLAAIVTRTASLQGQNTGGDNFWGKISEEMGFTRGISQCQDKWNQSLSKMLKCGGRVPRWTANDSCILVHKVDLLGVQDDTEIIWNTILDPTCNWTGRDLRRRWNTLKSSIQDWQNKSHSEIVSALKVKFYDIPPRKTSVKTMSISLTGSQKESDV